MLIRRILSLILLAAHVLAQQQQQPQNLPLNTLNTLSLSSSDSTEAFTFDRGNEQTTYYVSLSLCTDVTPYPQFYVSNSSNSSNVALNLNAGLATWNGTSPAGLLIYALPGAPTSTPTKWSFQLTVSTSGESGVLLLLPNDYTRLSITPVIIFVATSGVPPAGDRSPALTGRAQAFSTDSSTKLLE